MDNDKKSRDLFPKKDRLISINSKFGVDENDDFPKKEEPIYEPKKGAAPLGATPNNFSRLNGLAGQCLGDLSCKIFFFLFNTFANF